MPPVGHLKDTKLKEWQTLCIQSFLPIESMLLPSRAQSTASSWHTQQVNPDVSKAQAICDDHSLLERFGEISPRDVLLEFCQVCFRSLDECHVAPAMTQAHTYGV
jgi:hypothetical protein